MTPQIYSHFQPWFLHFNLELDPELYMYVVGYNVFLFAVAYLNFMEVTYRSAALQQAGLLINCFKIIEYFRSRFWSQNHRLFFFRFFYKNLKYIAYSIVCDEGVILSDLTA